jgi:hypothetical protein
MLTGTITIIKLKVVTRYKIKKKLGNGTMQMDHDVEFKYRPQPSDAVTIDEVVQAFADGSKHDKGQAK